MNIKKVISEHGWTIERLAAEMYNNREGKKGMTQSSLSQMLNGNPTIDKLREIACIIGVPLTEMLADEDSDIKGYLEVKGNVYKINSMADVEKVVQIAKE